MRKGSRIGQALVYSWRFTLLFPTIVTHIGPVAEGWLLPTGSAAYVFVGSWLFHRLVLIEELIFLPVIGCSIPVQSWFLARSQANMDCLDYILNGKEIPFFTGWWRNGRTYP
ncbi:hypothetical protein FHK02_1772 [Spirosoma sp. LMG 31448]|uniref:Uncharacterized protein n=1 Tax=Spirosoma utsteinense TaxID=2585773 RepID=A0ABR6WC72_9BACT|nr:hypothetical protein [Spirosoma utsteinense]MBC3793879.1 hypothetical protein [Spirosoma utsteinense]